jgi:hypothetical protein
MQKVHDLNRFTMREAYDYTQYSESILDGDIMLVDDGVAVMVEAWPVMAVGESTVFHQASPDFHTETGNKYMASFDQAKQPLDELKRIAKSYDMRTFFDEIES